MEETIIVQNILLVAAGIVLFGIGCMVGSVVTKLTFCFTYRLKKEQKI